MTISDITKIVTVVAVAQLITDLLTRRCIFLSDSYIRTVQAFERAQSRRDKTVSSIALKHAKLTTASQPSIKSTEKDQKKLQRDTEEVASLAAEVARSHTVAGFFSSLVSFVLYKILTAEYSGTVLAVLPFEPFGWMQRFTFAGFGGSAKLSVDELQIFWLESIGMATTTTPGANNILVPQIVVTSVSQACAFTFIYIISSFSIKMMINMVFGTKPPGGADNGVGALIDSPMSRKMMAKFGLDMNEVNEARSALGFS